MSEYIPYEKEVITYERFDCQWFGKNTEEPCWGEVIEDEYYPEGFLNCKVVTIYYTCEGHYDCIEGGEYVGKN